MKQTRKLISLALIAVLMMAMSGITVFATGSGSISVDNAASGETYNIYKMFDLVVDDENSPSAYMYSVNSDWADFFGNDGAGFISTSNGSVTINSGDEAALAAAAAAYAASNNIPTADDPITAGIVEWSGLDNGYYLITSTRGTKAMAASTPANPSQTISEKNPSNSLTKQVQEDSDSLWGSSNDAQIGDTVNFKSEITLYPGTRNVVFHDTMDSGLTYNDDATISGLDSGSYTITSSGSDTITVNFDNSYLNSLSGATTLTLTYSATLNTNAINGSTIVPQTNEAYLVYGGGSSTEHVTTTTTTHSFSVFKHASGSSQNLAGATFSLKKNGTVVPLIYIDQNTYRVAVSGESGVDTFTTVSSGNIVILGVDSDDYTLQETQAPTGYNTLSGEVSVNVSDDNGTQADIINSTGTLLPSTGGIGTTVFYVVGLIAVLGAGIFLVTNKRMAKEDI